MYSWCKIVDDFGLESNTIKWCTQMKQQAPPLSSSPPRPECKRTNSKSLLDCVYKNDIDGVKQALQENVMSWNTKNERGTTPLMEASILNRGEILSVLLSFKCDVNATDVEGNTALHLAVDEGNTEIVRKLVESGRCIVDAANEKGETALMKASFYDYTDMVRILLKDGDANTDATDKAGQTALMIALKEGSHSAVDLLLKQGCNHSVTDTLGHSALYYAIHSPCNKTLDLAKKLIAAGYHNDFDRSWMLNEEKHNLFYQDDEFYVELRKRLRSFNTEAGNCRKVSIETNSSHKSASVSPIMLPFANPNNVSLTSPPFAMSPRLKQRIMSPEPPKFPIFNFNKSSGIPGDGYTSSCSSPAAAKRSDYRKAESFEKMKPRGVLRRPLTSSMSSDSDHSPNASPLLRKRSSTDTRQVPVTQSVSGALQQEKQVLHVAPKALTNVPPPQDRTIKPISKLTVSVRNGDAVSRSAPSSPMMQHKRETNTQIPRAGSEEAVRQRKTSLPAKTSASVQFSAHIQVIEYNSRL